ncbi:MAG: hypothetical protein ACOC1I_07890, partial [Spirochaetota bacterium]
MTPLHHRSARRSASIVPTRSRARTLVVLLTAPLLATTALSGCAGTPPTVESYPEWSARRMKLNEIEVHYFDFFAQEPATPVVWIH